MISLDQTIINKPYKVIEIRNESSIKRRFLDIGMIPGAQIQKVLKNPFGGISAYSIMGATIAIRDQDAKEIKVINASI